MANQIQEDGITSVLLNKAAWLEALATLEAEFIAFQNRSYSSPPAEIAPMTPASISDRQTQSRSR